jgi:hypothetical protein
LKVKAQIQNLVFSSTYSEVKRSISLKVTGNIIKWSGYREREGKEDVQEKCGWKVYEQP